jgi:pyridoxamine 5'-phosphate oxidase
VTGDLFAEAMISFRELLDEARATGDPEPTAMTLASVDDEGRPSARIVLLKSHDERGFVFYTNYRSRKGRELLAHPPAALLFHWKTLRNQIQVRIEGRIETVGAAEADTYFASRPRASQIGAWASDQSETLATREEFERRILQYERQFAHGAVPRPPHWSGFRLVPDRMEFWYGAEFRLHERYCYECLAGVWHKRMLYP